PRPAELAGLEVLDEVREHQGSARAVEEFDFGHEAAGDRERVDGLVPRIACARIELTAGKVDVIARLLPYPRRKPHVGVRICPTPLGNPPVVDTVRPDDMAHAADRGDLRSELL